MKMKTRTIFLVLFSLILFFLFLFLGMELYYRLLFLMAYFWNYCLFSEQITEKYSQDRFRYSFIGLLVRGDLWFLEIWNRPDLAPFRRSISPFLFSLCLIYFSGISSLFFSILGSATFELALIEFYRFSNRD